MARFAKVVAAGLFLALAGVCLGADAPAGTYKLTFFSQGRAQTFWLIKLEPKDGKWTGSVLGTTEGVPPSTLEDLSVVGDRVRFTIRFQKQELTFEGKAPKDPTKKLLGVLSQRNQMILAQLEPTKLSSLDSYEVNKEIVANPDAGPELFDAALELLQQAGEKKAKPEEVRGWAARAIKAAEPYGPRWHREVAGRVTDTLLAQQGFDAIALEYARLGERLLEPSDELEVQTRALNQLAAALKKAGKTDELKELQARLAKLDAKADQEYLKKMTLFKPDAFAGRKTKTDRVVLIELFTGAQCPPCVAADLAFDAVEKTYKPADVVLLQYHLHVPGPDPLTNPDSEAREEYYALEGTPTIFFNGRANPGDTGGGAGDAEDRYKGFRKVIDKMLEVASPVKLKAGVQRKGEKLTITAEASEIDNPGDKMRLRLALVEELVRYTGGNQLRLHHRVVRALPGGAEGLALKARTGKQSAAVDLAELRDDLNKYLDAYAKKRPFPNANRPLDLKKLSVVAFVQNDETKEILQAVQVAVPEE